MICLIINYRWIGIAAALFIVGGAVGFLAGRLHQVSSIRQIAQQDVLEGYALSLQANNALQHRNSVLANRFSTESETYLLSAITPLEKLGVHHAFSVLTSVQQAEYDVVHGKATTRERQVLRAFQHALSPYSHYGFGTIPESRLQAAMNHIQATIQSK